ncbi:hypothetical protein F4776DRAFT_326175 [Hypoxylon sp. NC0597]|nr:hypothetical protein F4776DRAFT_326175 [Hypoxylon sp. NC0597]
MASPHCARIFASTDRTSTVPLHKFNLFPDLPPELRIKIWNSALERQRIIKVRLRNRVLMNGLLARQGVARPQTREGERYSVVVDGYHALSKLFCVNRESRDAALSFYRVHLPCWFVKDATRDDAMKPGILYFNPEHDFLYINTDTGHIANFLHDLKTIHDPGGVGLLNLAIDGNGLTGGFGLCTIDHSTLDPLVRTSFIETLMQLQEVFFVQLQRTGRLVFGYKSGAPTHENNLNLSFPMFATEPNFNRLDPDPRSIGRDLGKVFVNADPRSMLYAWGRLFYNYFGGHVVPETEYRVLLAVAPLSNNVYDRRGAEMWLKLEEDDWARETSRDDQPGPIPGDDPKTAVEAAFGFWLFPVDAFGALPQNPNDRFRTEGPRYLDLREHWPELALVNLT